MRISERMAFRSSALLLIAAAWLLVWTAVPVSAAGDRTKLVYDEADLLTPAEEAELSALAGRLGAERETSYLVIALNGTGGKDIVEYVQDFYDEQAPGYDRPHGNTAILTIDMQSRDVYLAGFKQAETYLDSGRLDSIRNRITPKLSEGDYYGAFTQYVKLAHNYMGYEPGVNPNNPLFRWWFQLGAAVVVAGVITGLMAYRSGGRVTVNAQTYINREQSKVLSRSDRFLHQTITKRKIPKNNSGGGGGGGGMTRGGHSHSGSRGKF